MMFGVDGWLEVEVELLDGAPAREVREAEPGVEPALPGGGGFLGDERGEELEAVLALVTVGEAGEDLGGPVELEVAEVILDRFDQCRRAHQPPPKHSQPDETGSCVTVCGPFGIPGVIRVRADRAEHGQIRCVDVVVPGAELEHSRRLGDDLDVVDRTQVSAVAAKGDRLGRGAMFGYPLRIRSGRRDVVNGDELTAQAQLERVAGALAACAISLWMRREVRQVGIMKTLGARSSQIAGQYLALMTPLVFVAVAFAFPIGTALGRWVVRYHETILNIDIADWRVPRTLVFQEIIFALGIPLLAMGLPIMRAARISPRQAIQDPGIVAPRGPIAVTSRLIKLPGTGDNLPRSGAPFAVLGD